MARLVLQIATSQMNYQYKSRFRFAFSSEARQVSCLALFLPPESKVMNDPF
jgi:GR25 family glycosyltransferase involved in LPS biosynthesis